MLMILSIHCLPDMIGFPNAELAKRTTREGCPCIQILTELFSVQMFPS